MLTGFDDSFLGFLESGALAPAALRFGAIEKPERVTLDVTVLRSNPAGDGQFREQVVAKRRRIKPVKKVEGPANAGKSDTPDL
ncbi:hypothetical protein ABBQ38_006206 [Trebouxia sp. C0009 RCD-2024]